MQTHEISTCVPPEGVEGDMAWKCQVPGCGEVIEFVKEEADVIAFLIVHHLVKKHGFTKNRVLAYDEELGRTVDEYIGFPKDEHGKFLE